MTGQIGHRELVGAIAGTCGLKVRNSSRGSMPQSPSTGESLQQRLFVRPRPRHGRHGRGRGRRGGRRDGHQPIQAAERRGECQRRRPAARAHARQRQNRRVLCQTFAAKLLRERGYVTRPDDALEVLEWLMAAPFDVPSEELWRRLGQVN